MRIIGGMIVVAAVLATVLAVFDQAGEWDSRDRGRREGIRAAETDLEAGTPFLRRGLGGMSPIGRDGLGIDRRTGIPLQSTFLMCGTGVDVAARRARIEAYNERILQAFDAGELATSTLGHKLRTDAQLRAILTAGQSRRLAHDGDFVQVGARCDLTFRAHGDDADARFFSVDVDAPRRERRTVFFVTPPDLHTYYDGALGPLQVWIVDDETTAIVRAADGVVWILDLPRAHPVQVVRMDV